MKNETERRLNEEGLLEPNSYEEPPSSMRWKYILTQNWPLPIFLALVVFATIYLIAVNGMGSGIIAIISLVIIPVVLIGLWATYWHGSASFQPSYEVKGLKVKFDSTQYYVPPNVMGEFIQEVFDAFDHVVDFDSAKMFNGVRLVIKDERPVDPLNRIPQERMVGLTFPGRKLTSYVYGPYALSHGGAGYELRLQGCEFLFPGRAEGDDIEWMQENKVI